MQSLRLKIPILLIVLRFLFAPAILAITFLFHQTGTTAIVILMYLGLLSDIFDGIIARHLGIATPKLRRLDSQVDMVFWIAIGISAYVLFPEIIKANSIPIILVFAMEAACYAISFIRFGKEPCTHAFLAKMWGITLLIAFTSLIGFGYAGIPFALAIIFGLLSHLDRIFILLILPHWTHDIPSAYHAILIRKGISFKKNKLFN